MAYMKDATGRRLDDFEVADVATVTPALQNALNPVATRACPSFDSSVGHSDGVILGGTAKNRTSPPGRSTACSWPSPTVRRCMEQNGPNAMTVRAAVEPLGNIIIPVTFVAPAPWSSSPGRLFCPTPSASTSPRARRSTGPYLRRRARRGRSGRYPVGAAGHPLKGWFEIATLAESGENSGKWKANYTADGTHPNPTGAAALAAGINPAVFGAASTA